MKYFTYGRVYIDKRFEHPNGLLPVNTTCSIFYNYNWYGSSEVDDLNSLLTFDPSEITKEKFDEAYSYYMSDKTGSI